MRTLLPLILVLGTGCAHAIAARDLALVEDALHVCRCIGVGLGAGHDVAGGPERLWVADEKGVSAVGLDGAVEPQWAAPRFQRLVRMEAADLDGDGADEWIVVVEGGRMRSAVVAFGPEGRALAGGWFQGYLRPERRTDGTWRLVGQRSGGDRPFRGTPEEVTWTSDGFTVGAALSTPSGSSLFDSFWLPGEARDRLFVLEDSGHLSERDARSPRARLWRSDDRPVARPIEIERSYRELLGSEEEEVLRLPSPVVVGERAGRVGALLVGGNAMPVAVFRNLRVLQGGELRWLEAAHRGLEEVVRTPVLGTAMVAGVLWQPPGRQPLWVGLAWTRDPSGFAPPESRVFLFEPERGDVVSPSAVAILSAPPVEEVVEPSAVQPAEAQVEADPAGDPEGEAEVEPVGDSDVAPAQEPEAPAQEPEAPAP